MLKLQAIMTMLGVGGSFLFGAWTPLLSVLLVFITIDIVTGIAKGFYNKELRSRNMSQGMIRKSMIFVVLIIANMIDVLAFGGLPVAKSAVTSFYIGMEGLSILENLGQMDVPLPDSIKNHLLSLKKTGEKFKETQEVDEIKVTKNDVEITVETKNNENSEV